MEAQTLVPTERIAHSILVIRDQKVLLDSALADLYNVDTRTLVQATQRNLERFPRDFMFQLTREEYEALRSQNVISNSGRGGRRYLPYAFTEQGVAMLSSVLRSPQAVQVNIEIMRVFVRLRELVSSNEELSRRLNDLEKRYDSQFQSVFAAIRQLMSPPHPPKRRLGFSVSESSSGTK